MGDSAAGEAGAGLRPGDHLCHLFEGAEEQLAVLRAFTLDALDANEDVLVVGPAALARALAASVASEPQPLWPRPGLEGRVHLWGPEAMVDGDGVFQPERFADRVRAETRASHARGRDGVRVAVDMTWAAGFIRDQAALARYEDAADGLLVQPGQGAGIRSLLCQFNVSSFPAATILEMADRHRLVAVQGRMLSDANPDPETERFFSRVRQRAVREVRGRAVLYRSVFEHMSSGVTLFAASRGGEDFVVLDCNQAAERLSGFSRGEVLGRSLMSVYPEPMASDLLAVLRRVWGDGVAERLDATPSVSERGTQWHERRVFRLPGGEVVAVWDDVTERVRNEEQLQRAIDHLDALIAACPVPVVGIDTDGCVIVWNPAAETAFGWRTDEVVGRTIPWVPQGKEEESQANHDRQMGGYSFHGEVFERRKKDGTLIDVALYTSPLCDRGGNVMGSTGVAMDVTESKRAARALRDSEEKYRRLVEMAQEGIWLVDSEGRTMLVNSFMASMLGYEPEEMMGRPLFEFLVPDDVPLAARRFDRRRAGFSEVHEFRYLRKDGTGVDTVMSVVPFFDDEGAFSGAMAMVSDLSVRQELERERLRAAKLESLGTLAGGVAHDFNNLLTGIMGNISLAREVEDRAERDEILRASENAAQAAVGLTKQLLTFAKGGAPVKHVGSVRPLIEQSVGLVLAGSRVRAELDLQETLAAEIDPGQVGQVIQNLALNARDAMPDGGTLTVVTRDHVDDERRMFVELVVRDEGEGIPPEIMDRLFDPYFTTKEAGTGLGLAVVHSVVSRHGGYVTVESTLGRGSAFHVFLPAVPPPRGGDHAQEPAGTAGVALSGRVMVVDDEPAVRTLLQRTLGDMGLEVVACADGAEAFSAYEDMLLTGTRFDLVITDLTMPGGIGGEELVRRLLELDPQATIIVSSGYSHEAIMSDFRAYGVAATLEKPYTIMALRDRVATLLSEPV